MNELAKAAQLILDNEKGIEAQRGELARLQGLILNAEQRRDALASEMTKRAAEKTALDKSVAELSRDRDMLIDTAAKLRDEIAKLRGERDTLESELASLRARVGISA